MIAGIDDESIDPELRLELPHRSAIAVIMPKELTIYTGTIHKFAIISNHDQRSIEPSIDQSSALGMARCDNAPGKNRQVPGDAYCCCCLLLSVVSTLDSVRLVIGRQKCAVAYWKLIGNNMASSGCASSLFVVVVPCCCLLLLLLSSISVVMSNAFITRRNA